MFDPTAFDNMKVVIEGILYDKDIDGEYEIIDRNDFINLSKMDRQFSIQYKQIKKSRLNTSCKITLSSNANDIYKELISGHTDVGCLIEIEFIYPEELKMEIIQRSLLLLQKYTKEEFIPIQNIKQSIFDKNRIEASLILKFINKITEDDFNKLEELLHISEIMVQWYDEQLLKEI